MKKNNLCLVMIVALTVLSFFLATTADAQDTQVTSNVVGHLQVQMQPGRNFVGLNFKNPEADKTAYDVQELLNTSNLKGGKSMFESDRLFLWDPAGQEYIELWLLDSGGDYPELDGKWWDPEAGAVAEQIVYPGDGFFLIAQEATEVVLSGEVQENITSFTHAALDERSMIASAWPVDIKVNEMELNGVQGGKSMFESDRLFLWDVDNQEYIELWLLDSGGDYPELDGKWWDPEAGAVAEQVLSAGSAAFIIKQTNDELIESKPY